jgi:hypothetical protein
VHFRLHPLSFSTDVTSNIFHAKVHCAYFIYIVTCFRDYRRGLDSWIDLVTTTNNYNAVANLHTSQITRSHAKFSQSAFASRFPATDLNNEDSSACVLISLQSGEYPTTEHIVKVIFRLTVSQSVSLGVEPHLGLMTRYLLLFDSYGLVFVGRPLWREDGSIFCICCWPFPALLFLGPSPLGLATTFCCLGFEISFFVAFYDSQGHGGGIRPRLHTGIEHIAPTVLVITTRHGPHRKHRSSIVFVSIAAVTCLPSRCLETAATRTTENTVLQLLRALPNNGRCLQSHCLATGLYTSVCFLCDGMILCMQ